jgi:hypothetical protein
MTSINLKIAKSSIVISKKFQVMTFYSDYKLEMKMTDLKINSLHLKHFSYSQTIIR